MSDITIKLLEESDSKELFTFEIKNRFFLRKHVYQEVIATMN